MRLKNVKPWTRVQYSFSILCNFFNFIFIRFIINLLAESEKVFSLSKTTSNIPPPTTCVCLVFSAKEKLDENGPFKLLARLGIVYYFNFVFYFLLGLLQKIHFNFFSNFCDSEIRFS